MNADVVALLASGAWVTAVLAAAEAAHRRGWDRVDSRRVVHVGVGTWILPTFLLFETRMWAVLPPVLFVGVNALSLRHGLLRSVEVPGRGVGTVLFPLSVAVLLFVGWEEPWRPVAAAGVLVMAWGDAAASWVGRRWGRRIYRVRGHPRSLEGSAALLLVGTAATAVAFAVVGDGIGAGRLAAGLCAAAVATGLEAVSLRGADNLLVPLGTAGCLALLHGGLWS
jgi:dolichol kinase